LQYGLCDSKHDMTAETFDIAAAAVLLLLLAHVVQ
jgi:hypothetical protein